MAEELAAPNVITPAHVAFAPKAFDVEAIKRAAYRLGDRLAVDIDVREESIACELHPLSPSTPAQLEALANEFRSEVLDQDLRIRIAQETEPVRNLVLSLAFSKTGLQG